MGYPSRLPTLEEALPAMAELTGLEEHRLAPVACRFATRYLQEETSFSGLQRLAADIKEAVSKREKVLALSAELWP